MKALGLTKISLTLLLGLMTAIFSGCGQSKVEYRRVELRNEIMPESTLSPEQVSNLESALNPNGTNPNDPNNDESSFDSDKPGKKKKKPPGEASFAELSPSLTGADLTPSATVAATTFTSELSSQQLHDWQKWLPPTKRGVGLSTEESVGLGDYSAKREALFGEEEIVLTETLQKRCVYRNRLLENVNDPTTQKDKEEILPPPFGNAKVFCVELANPVASKTRLSLKKENDLINVRWLGTSASKAVSAKGKHTVEFKLTSRIKHGQGFNYAARESLQDGFDFLINTTINEQGGTDCGLERTYFLAINFENGKVVNARIAVRTRMFSTEDFEDSFFINRTTLPIGYWHDDHRMPKVYTSAHSACQFQRAAWAYCARSEAGKPAREGCNPALTEAVESNFRELIDARSPGFLTDRVFVLTRKEANGVNGNGALVLWHDPEVVGSNKHEVNLLSLEDFQDMTDLIDLDVSFK